MNVVIMLLSTGILYKKTEKKNIINQYKYIYKQPIIIGKILKNEKGEL